MENVRTASLVVRCIVYLIETKEDPAPLDLVAFDLWGLSRVQSAGGKVYMMVIVDAGLSHKSGVYLPDKSDTTTIQTFNNFCTKAETMTRRKIHRLQTDQAFESTAWEEYCQHHGIMHEFTAPYSSAQNGLAECAIRTTIDDVCTLLHDSSLSHLYWAEAAAYSIETCNLIPSCIDHWWQEHVYQQVELYLCQKVALGAPPHLLMYGMVGLPQRQHHMI